MNLKAAFSFALNRCLNSHFGPLTLSIALQLLPGHHLCNRTHRGNMQKRVCAPLFVQALISSSGCRAKMRGQGGATTPAACIKARCWLPALPCVCHWLQVPKAPLCCRYCSPRSAHVSELTTPSSQVTEAQLQRGCGPSFHHQKGQSTSSLRQTTGGYSSKRQNSIGLPAVYTNFTPILLFSSKMVKRQRWEFASAVLTLLLLPPSVWKLQARLPRGAAEETHIQVLHKTYFTLKKQTKQKQGIQIIAIPSTKQKCRKSFKKPSMSAAQWDSLRDNITWFFYTGWAKYHEQKQQFTRTVQQYIPVVTVSLK